MDPTDIENIVVIIQNSTQKNKEEHYANIYPEFKQKYPLIYTMVCTTKMDMNNLKFMLTMLAQMHKNEKTQYDASADVGQMLFDKYVDPKINT